MTGNELDEILAEQESETQAETQARDDHGRFATKAEQPEVVAEAPVEQPEPQPEVEPARVPQQALHAAREKAREKDAENEQLRRELAELRGQVQVLARQPTPQTATQQAPTPEIWDDPNGFVQAALTPVQKAMQQQAELFSRRMAVKEHGHEAVQSAYAALGAAMQGGDPSAQAEFQRIRASDDPYEDIVQWHKRTQTLQRVGSDPEAWLEAEMEKRLADPAVQAKFLEKIKGTAAANTSRSNPVTSLPPSLNRLPAGGNVADENDASDAALFSFAMR